MAGTEHGGPGAIPELDTEQPTAEVASEGGSPGDVETDRRADVGTGSEAGETWRPAEDDVDFVRRDDTGQGRRSPSGGE